MTPQELLDPQRFLLFTLVLSRVSGLVMIVPVLGSKNIPVRIRGLLALSLSVVLFPAQWKGQALAPAGLLEYGLLIGRELSVGITLGLGVVILLGGVQLSGQLISQISGMSLSDVYNPTVDGNIPLFSDFLSWCSLAVFVCVGGHRQVIGALLETFANLPPGSDLVTHSVLETSTSLITNSLELGIRVGAPTVTAQLLATVLLGLVSRTLPQLNIMALGFGFNSLATLGAMWFSLGAMAWAFQDEIEPMLAQLVTVLGQS